MQDHPSSTELEQQFAVNTETMHFNENALYNRRVFEIVHKSQRSKEQNAVWKCLSPMGPLLGAGTGKQPCKEG